MRNAALLALVALLLVPLAAGGVLAAAPNGTATPANTPADTPTATATPTASPTPTPEPTPTVPRADRIAELQDDLSSPYDYSWLKQPGEPAPGTGGDIPPVRALPSVERGFVGAQYQDPSLLDVAFGSEARYIDLEHDDLVRTNTVQLYASAAGDYDLIIVYWQENRTRVNDSGINRPVAYAYNQTVRQRNVTFDGRTLYTYHNVSLTPHFDETWRVTMWLENADGERVAKWVFRHRSNPQFQSVGITSLVGAWGFTFRNGVGPGIAGAIIGLFGARWTLRRVGRGPGYGVVMWAVMLGVLSLFILPTAGFYYQVAVVLQNLPWVMGLSIAVVAFAIGLTFHEDVRRIAFHQRELGEAKSSSFMFGRAAADGGVDVAADELRGPAELFDELTGAIFADMPEVPVVRTGDTYRVPVEGIRPFFARLFARAAEFDPSDIATRFPIREGRLDDIIVVDPSGEEAVVHKPARLVRALPWDTMKREYAERDITPGTADKALAAALSLLIALGPPVGGWVVADALWNIGPVGMVVGILVTAVAAYTAEDGWIDFEPAPEHYKKAEENITVLQRAYSDAADQRDARKAAWEERARSVREAREDQQAERRTITAELIGEDGREAGDGD